jgi:putative mRNA 3-end processing factor
MRFRLGKDILVEGVEYGEKKVINGVEVSFHPAGHVPGSSQIKLVYQGDSWIVSGDYKVEYDGLSPAFEPVKGRVFITESTFGLPIFDWKPQTEIFNQINNWWINNQNNGKCSVILCYALGKAQRVLKNLNHEIGEVYCHGGIHSMNEVIEASGFELPTSLKVDASVKKSAYQKALILAPPSASNSPWMKKFGSVSVASVSGWMAIRGNKARRGVDMGFSLSDHADWKGLNQAIKSSEAELVYVTHGYTHQFSKWLNEQGIESYTVNTLFENQFVGEKVDEEVVGLESSIEGD